VGYDIVIVHTDNEHFVTLINCMAVHPDRSISTGPLQVQACSSAMKRLHLRGIVTNNNPLQNNLDTGEMSTPSDTGVTDVTIANSVPSYPNDVTPTENPGSTNNNQVQNNLDISTHLRP
jgi:hypothetical protein